MLVKSTRVIIHPDLEPKYDGEIGYVERIEPGTEGVEYLVITPVGHFRLTEDQLEVSNLNGPSDSD